jgi:hypothetical protein
VGTEGIEGLACFRPTLPCRVGTANPISATEVERAFDPVVAIDWARASRDLRAAASQMMDALLSQIAIEAERAVPGCHLVAFQGGEDAYGKLRLRAVRFNDLRVGHVSESLEVAWRGVVSLLATGGIDDPNFTVDLSPLAVMTACGDELDPRDQGVIVEFGMGNEETQ